MNKLNLLLIGIILVAFSCNTQPGQEKLHTTTVGMGTPYYAMPEVLNGKVKEVTEKIYLAVEKDGTYVKGERMNKNARDTLSWTSSYIALFDPDGNLLRSANIDENDKELYYSTQDVEEGKPVGSKSYSKDTLRVETYYTYSDSENSVNFERKRMPEDTLINNVKVYFDSTEAYKLWEIFNFSDELIYRYEYTSSDDGRSTGYKVLNKDGEQLYSLKGTLNDHGFSAQDVSVNRAGEETTMDLEYTYDDRGNWISRVITAPDFVVIEERALTYYGDEIKE